MRSAQRRDLLTPARRSVRRAPHVNAIILPIIVALTHTVNTQPLRLQSPAAHTRWRIYLWLTILNNPT